MLVEDVEKLTGIPSDLIVKLLKKGEFSILDSLYECKLNGNDIYEADIYIGKILLKLMDGEIKFKFIPSPEFLKSCKDILIKNNEVTFKKLEKSLVTKITEAYKDLF